MSPSKPNIDNMAAVLSENPVVGKIELLHHLAAVESGFASVPDINNDTTYPHLLLMMGVESGTGMSNGGSEGDLDPTATEVLVDPAKSKGCKINNHVHSHLTEVGANRKIEP